MRAILTWPTSSYRQPPLMQVSSIQTLNLKQNRFVWVIKESKIKIPSALNAWPRAQYMFFWIGANQPWLAFCVTSKKQMHIWSTFSLYSAGGGHWLKAINQSSWNRDLQSWPPLDFWVTSNLAKKHLPFWALLFLCDLAWASFYWEEGNTVNHFFIEST